MKVRQPKTGGNVTITLTLDQTLALAALLANVGDRVAGPLAGLYDEIGNAVEYKDGNEIGYSLYDAVNRKQEWTREFIDASHAYMHQYDAA